MVRHLNFRVVQTADFVSFFLRQVDFLFLHIQGCDGSAVVGHHIDHGRNMPVLFELYFLLLLDHVLLLVETHVVFEVLLRSHVVDFHRFDEGILDDAGSVELRRTSRMLPVA